MARRGFKRSLREQREASLRVMQFMAGAAPAHKREAAAEFIAGAQGDIKPKRERAAPRSLEGPVVAAISELLAVHPRVIWAARFNSGAASYEAASGKYAPVWFHKFLRAPEKMRMPDFFCLVDGQEWSVNPRCLPFAIEAKAPGWTKPRDDREREQATFLKMIRECGGIGIFATSADQVMAALK